MSLQIVDIASAEKYSAGIPKIIHYCWFGNSEKDFISKECMKTWTRYINNYQIIEWNEQNIDIDSMPQYVIEAYNSQKYAFVSDYVRLKVLYEYGGVYLDTDMEICKNFDELLDNYSFVSCFFEKLPMTSFFAAKGGNEIIKNLMDTYSIRKFINADGSYDMTPIDYGFSKCCNSAGLLLNGETQQFGEGYICYSNSYFCGIDTQRWRVKYSEETCSVHHLAASWKRSEHIITIKSVIKKVMIKTLGIHRFYKLTSRFISKCELIMQIVK